MRAAKPRWRKRGKGGRKAAHATGAEEAGPEAAGGGPQAGRDDRAPTGREAPQRTARAMRLPQNIGPHSARKVYAVELLAKYGDIVRVRRALNHSSEAVTLIYALADRQLISKQKRRRAAPGRSRV